MKTRKYIQKNKQTKEKKSDFRELIFIEYAFFYAFVHCVMANAIENGRD